MHRLDARATYLCTTPQTDACGLAPHGTGNLASDISGGLITLGPDGSSTLGSHALAFDNHIVTL